MTGAAVLLFLAFAWALFSTFFAALMPWDQLEKGDRGLALGFVLFWPLAVTWLAVEVAFENRKARR